MFHWICPECGREIAPTVRECPACDPGKEAVETVPAGVVEALARTLNVATPNKEALARTPNVATPNVATPGVEAIARTSHVEAPSAQAPAPGLHAEPAAMGSQVSEPQVTEQISEPQSSERSSDASAAPPAQPPAPPQARVKPTRVTLTMNARRPELAERAARLDTPSGRLDLGALVRVLRPSSRPESRRATNVEAPAAVVSAARSEPAQAEGNASIPAHAAGSSAVAAPIAPAPVLQPASPALPDSAALSDSARPVRRTAAQNAAPEPAPETGGREPILPSLGGSAVPDDPFEDLMLAWGMDEEPGTPIEAAALDATPDAAPDTTSDAALDAAPGSPHHAIPEAPPDPTIAAPAAGAQAAEGVPIEAIAEPPGETERRTESPAIEEAPPRASAQIFVPAAAIPPAFGAPVAEVRPEELAVPAVELQPVVDERPEPEPPLIRTLASLEPGEGAQGINAREARPWRDSEPTAIDAQPGAPERPGTPKPEPEPATAPLADYSPLAGRPLRPAAPRRYLFKNEVVARITLPGPALIKRLVAFDDPKLAPVPTELRRKFAKKGLPGWLVAVVILGTLLGAGFSSFLPSSPKTAAEASAPAAGATPASTPEPEISTPPPANSLSKSIEVTGFRILVDPSHKSQIEYLVVNHTANQFSGVTVYVTLRAGDAKPGQPPLCRFSFTAPALAPFESREMSSDIEKVNRPVSLPDWQNLRAEIEIGQ